MQSRTRLVPMVALMPIWLAAAGASTAPSIPVGGDAAFMQLADDYLDHYYFPNNPTSATLAGVHRYDGELEDYSRAAVERQIGALHSYQRRLQAADPTNLSERVAGDRELLLSNVRSALLTLQTIRPWRSNPDVYSCGIASSAFTIPNALSIRFHVKATMAADAKK